MYFTPPDITEINARLAISHSLASINMKHILGILFLLTFGLNIFSNDTIYIYDEEIFESKIDESSSLNIKSKTNGFDLIDFNDIGCKLIDFKTKPNYGLIEKYKINDTIILIIQQLGDCNQKYIGEIDADKSKIDLIFTLNGGAAECWCNNRIQYKIISQNSIPKKILINDKKCRIFSDYYKTHKIKYDIMDNDTINYRDKYGLKQGVHRKYGLFNDTIHYTNYINDEIIEEKKFYLNGRPKNYIKFQYQLKDGFIVIKTNATIKKWNNSGELIFNKKMSMTEYYKTK